MLNLELFQAIFSIVMIDLVLSGDNAVVIGMAARRLDPAQRRQAIIAGAGGAIILRVIFTIAAALLLRVPLIQAGGGMILLWIAFTLLRQEDEGDHEIRSGGTLFEAIRTIIIADVVMSLDNILAVGGAAEGHIPLLLFGLLLSMSLIMFGSNLVAALMQRLPWLVYLGAAVLVYTAGEMIFSDPIVGRYLPHNRTIEYTVIAVLIILIIGGMYWYNRRNQAAPRQPDLTDHPVSHSQ